MAEVDSALVTEAKSGNVKAFEELIKSHQKRVYNIALKMTGNPDDAYDMAQEVFIRAYKSIANFRGDASFSTWIYRITKNVCFDELRKRKRRKTVSLDEEVEMEDGSVKRQIKDESADPEEIHERKVLKEKVRDALKELCQEHRFVLVLRDLQGYSYEEISQITECPVGTVKSRISRARAALKDIVLSKKELLDSGYVKHTGKEGWR